MNQYCIHMPHQMKEPTVPSEVVLDEYYFDSCVPAMSLLTKYLCLSHAAFCLFLRVLPSLPRINSPSGVESIACSYLHIVPSVPRINSPSIVELIGNVMLADQHPYAVEIVVPVKLVFGPSYVVFLVFVI